MSGSPVKDVIKCRENTVDGRKKKISLYVQIVPWKETVRRRRLCSPLALNGSQCLNPLTAVVLSSWTLISSAGTAR